MPNERFGQLTQSIRGRFSHLFEGGGGGEREPYKSGTRQAIIRSAENRFFTGTRIRTEFGVDANKLNYYEYYLLLEQIAKSDKPNG
jgi:hypothetical protein